MIELVLLCLSSIALVVLLYCFHVIWRQMEQLQKLREKDLYSRKAKELRMYAKNSQFLTDTQFKELKETVDYLKEKLK